VGREFVFKGIDKIYREAHKIHCNAQSEDKPMVAYLIVDIDVQDQEGFARYREAVPPVVAKFG
jgi:hypothetical protein